jgi:hypothetical protein
MKKLENIGKVIKYSEVQNTNTGKVFIVDIDCGLYCENIDFVSVGDTASFVTNDGTCISGMVAGKIKYGSTVGVRLEVIEDE